ncbi:hypothetical protein GORHZ_111_00040 [Gordonia rhizosphera NBRC 16068]|uniref:Uncharacterized protein n=2 Tax=Gordonia rhizosphera TaxID=83341 RepID=K6WA27_9ACTN|nr:hypothetical protein GORHZ_111_00040 [Gordonia rhizosphera NBRC 16068]
MTDHTKGFNAGRAEEVALGIAMSGHVRLWRGGEPSLWKIHDMSDSDELERLQGSGAISTNRFDRAHHRESASLDIANQVLCVGKTLASSHRGGLTHGHGIFIKVSPTNGTKKHPYQSWESVEDVIIRATDGAQARGEVLVVGKGPDPRAAGPSVLLSTSTVNAWTYSVVSASPAPTLGAWAEHESAPTDNRTTLVATLSPMSRGEAAELAAEALKEWGVEPFDVGIAYVVPIELLASPTSPALAGQ